MDRKPVHIAYFTVNDPLDKRSWSGITYYLGQSLQRNIGSVDFLGPVEFPYLLTRTLWGVAKLHRLLFGTEFYTKYSLLLNWYATRWLSRKMKGKQYDFVCAPASSPALAYLRTDVPVIHVQDSTFRSLTSTYMEFKKASRLSLWTGQFLERKALGKCAFIVYSSHWAADSAIHEYGVPAGKIFVRPLGANMDRIPGREGIFEKEQNKELTLLYLAVEWERKGGSIAYDTLRYLHDTLGVKARLIICGCTPPEGFSHPYMEVIPFLNKNKPEDHARFIQLLSTSHFLLLPTRADCSLLVACESNAYGMPAITARAGGVPDLVRDGVNGYCLPYEAGGAEYASRIAEIYGDRERYHALIASSRQRFEEALTWDRWAEDFAGIYPRVLSGFRKR